MPSNSHIVLIPSFNTGLQVLRDRPRRPSLLGSGLGCGRRQHGRDRRAAEGLGSGRPGPARARPDAQPGQGCRRPVRLARGAGDGLQPRADHGCGRAASGGEYPIVHGGICGPTGCHDPGCAGVRRGRPALRVQGRRISNWWARLETLGADIGDLLFGFRVYPMAATDGGHAGPPLDAPVRLRSRGRRTPVLGGVPPDQSASPGQVSAPGGGRRLALPLWPRQHDADLDAHPAGAGCRCPPANAAAPAAGSWPMPPG